MIVSPVSAPTVEETDRSNVEISCLGNTSTLDHFARRPTGLVSIKLQVGAACGIVNVVLASSPQIETTLHIINLVAVGFE
jgi:hypothetical protein